jgi:hypothetical protein
MTEYKAGDVLLLDWGGRCAEYVVSDVVAHHSSGGEEQILLYGHWRYREAREGTFCWGPTWVTSALSKPHPHPAAVRADLVKQLVREAAGGGGQS